MKQQIKALFLAASAIAVLTALLANTGTPGVSAASGLPFPRLANYYLGSISDPATLAHWDVAIVGGENNIASQYASVRQSNPNMKLVPYMADEEPSWQDPGGPIDASTGFSNSWYLKRADGSTITGWGGRQLINASTAAPWVNGQRWIEHLAAWTIPHFHNAGIGDGVFYDNAWNEVSWLDPNIDLDNNGLADLYESGKGASWVDHQWQAGLLSLMQQTRTGMGSSAILIGNGDLQANATNNGRLNEGFDGNWVPQYQSSDWNANLLDYLNWGTSHYGDNYYVLNHSAGQSDYQTMRFYLGTTLLGDGYYAYDGPNGVHYALWWYDEYSVDLSSGQATGDASKKGYLGFPHGPATQLQSGLWERVYDNGIVLVNPTGGSVYQNLGGSYRLIKGSQDSGTNNGATVTGLNLASRDARILLNVGGAHATPTNTAVASQTPTNTPKPSSTPTNTPAASATPTNTPKPSSTPTNTPVGSPSPTQTPTSVNLAVGKAATSSSVDCSCRTPNLAVDGSLGTRWSSAYTDSEWFQVDLGARHDLTGAVLHWEWAYGKDYSIQVSNTGRHWRTVYNRTGGTGGTDTLNFNTSGRYVRVVGLTRGTQWGYSLWELQVMGT